MTGLYSETIIPKNIDIPAVKGQTSGTLSTFDPMFNWGVVILLNVCENGNADVRNEMIKALFGAQ